ncbi:AAR192Cp [Eremothecium gossypii ATCC 10895]|uniref:AAR192Cp n=1 Tax=Eremothecium gossypii (strain ATCC 10895 / CBS 109.51 / FGSC 9923 / NRRL Y-1056) TaxID=284811 RepID=Q75E88_EREGS|nr:AAR192Cp [Eremothecium gossypii ATCC 10895]AAS50559.1 AAR192Cp [Eremothecium gossypii ATCC 10895]AEY94846.1 FAAR192Cp [Eremothecium gossypii FDAG1]
MGKVGYYLKTRVTELFPEKRPSWEEFKYTMNPANVLSNVKLKTWLFIASAFLALTVEATDFFLVSLNVVKIAEDLHVREDKVTWGITVALMTRTIGAIVYGYVGDRFGQRTSFLINIGMISVLQLVTGFATSFPYFLACRAYFGVELGGCFGTATTQCLDDLPKSAHSWVTGGFQQAYAFGFLLATVLTRALADTTAPGWRSCFWFLSGVSFLSFVFRACLGQTEAFKERQRIKEEGRKRNEKVSTLSQILRSLKKEWYIAIYMVCLMAGYNFFSHASQDLFPTMLLKQLGYSSNQSTLTNIMANVGALLGGLLLSRFSSVSSRRFIILMCVFSAAILVYPWGFVQGSGMTAYAFLLQFFVQGAWGLVPYHLHSLAPDSQTKAFFVGVAYQMGNLISSPSSTMESSIARKFPIGHDANGKTIYDYGRVMAYFVWGSTALMFIFVFLGPEFNPNRAHEFIDDIESVDEQVHEVVEDKVEASPSIQSQTSSLSVSKRIHHTV